MTYDQVKGGKTKYQKIFFGGHLWLKITPPWLQGYRPFVTYRRIK